MNEFWDIASMACVGSLALVALLFVPAIISRMVRFVQEIYHAHDEHVIEMARKREELERYRLDHAVLISQPDRLIIPRAELSAHVVAQVQLALAQIDAQRTHAPVPATMHYAPHFPRVAAPAVAAIEGPDRLPGDEAPAQVAPPDFWSLFHQGALPKTGFLMGFDLDDRHAVTADWRKLYSALIGGMSGSGKSTLIRSILAQSALQHGRFVVIDPHAGSGDESLAESLTPLRRLMLCEPAAEDAQIRDALAYVASVGRARLAGKDQDHSPLILVVDELTGLLTRGNVSDELIEALGLIAQETRKVGVYALAIGQQFSSQVMQTSVRNSFVSFISCRARRDVARVMSGSPEFGKYAESMGIGQAVWMTPQGEIERVAVPNTTQHHLELVAQRIDGVWHASPPAAGSLPSPLPQQAANDAPGSEDGSEDGSAHYTSTTLIVDDARATRVRAAIRSGMSKSEILGDVWGVDMRKGGRKVTQASQEYDELIRALLEATHA